MTGMLSPSGAAHVDEIASDIRLREAESDSIGPILRRSSWFLMVPLGASVILTGCGAVDTTAAEEGDTQDLEIADSRSGRIWEPDEGDHLWFSPDSADELGSGGEFHIYLDPVIDPRARGSFAKFALGVDGALPEHRHARTEEIAYFISGEGIARLYEDGEPRDVPVKPGYVWYNPPGVWHSIANTGDEPLVLVFATIPNEEKGLLSFFRRVSVKPGQEPIPLPPEEMGRIAAEHDLILKPPGASAD